MTGEESYSTKNKVLGEKIRKWVSEEKEYESTSKKLNYFEEEKFTNLFFLQNQEKLCKKNIFENIYGS